MMKKFLFYLVTVTLVLTGLLRFSIEFETAQNIAMRQFAGLILNQQDLPQSDSLESMFVAAHHHSVDQTKLNHAWRL